MRHTDKSYEAMREVLEEIVQARDNVDALLGKRSAATPEELLALIYEFGKKARAALKLGEERPEKLRRDPIGTG